VFVAAVTFAAHHFNRAFVSGVRLNLDLNQRTEELMHRTEELTPKRPIDWVGVALGDQGFESLFLQRGVTCELTSVCAGGAP
jgi:hypothetical protein